MKSYETISTYAKKIGVKKEIILKFLNSLNYTPTRDEVLSSNIIEKCNKELNDYIKKHHTLESYAKLNSIELNRLLNDIKKIGLALNSLDIISDEVRVKLDKLYNQRDFEHRINQESTFNTKENNVFNKKPIDSKKFETINSYAHIAGVTRLILKKYLNSINYTPTRDEVLSSNIIEKCNKELNDYIKKHHTLESYAKLNSIEPKPKLELKLEPKPEPEPRLKEKNKAEYEKIKNEIECNFPKNIKAIDIANRYDIAIYTVLSELKKTTTSIQEMKL